MNSFQGVCSEGSLERPASGPKLSTCDKLYIEETKSDVIPVEASFSWHYVQCPPENECLNNHHNCDERSEECVDLEDGYKCECGKGYKLSGSECVPVSIYVYFYANFIYHNDQLLSHQK